MKVNFAVSVCTCKPGCKSLIISVPAPVMLETPTGGLVPCFKMKLQDQIEFIDFMLANLDGVETL